MDWEQIENQWPAVRGRFRESFEQLTDAEIDPLTGKKAELLKVLEGAYGYSAEEAELHLDKWRSATADAVEHTPTSTSGASTY